MDAQVNPDMIARLDELETRVRALEDCFAWSTRDISVFGISQCRGNDRSRATLPLGHRMVKCD
jgi:hypothetical protein